MMNIAAVRFSVGLEEGPDGSAHAHALTLPGCVASGASKEVALSEFAGTLAQWLQFLAAEGEAVPPQDRELEITVDEWIATDANIASGESNVCFAADRDPLTEDEILLGLRRLGSLRSRLLPYIRRARDEDLEKLGSPDRNARRILDELARAQWWTLTRLGSSPLAEVPERVTGRLDTAMALIVQELNQLTREARAQQLELAGEEWTARKVLRRLLWLEWALGSRALELVSEG